MACLFLSDDLGISSLARQDASSFQPLVLRGRRCGRIYPHFITRTQRNLRVLKL
jgi:hypothetical protein